MHFLKKSPADIIFLQDTHLTTRTIPYFDMLWNGKAYHSCKSNFSRGTSILIRSSVSHNVIVEESCPEGNFKIIVCEIQMNRYTLVSVYGPNEDQPEFYEGLENCLEASLSENMIIGGDWNFVLDRTRDSNYVYDNNKSAKSRFLETVAKYNLIDAWRQSHPHEIQYTWIKQNPLKWGRLDMVFISDHLQSKLTKCEIESSYRTDHRSVVCSLKDLNSERGTYLWKFNESLLTDPDYTSAVINCINQQISQYAIPLYTEEFLADTTNYDKIEFTIDIGLFYETLLMMIRGETIQFSKRKARRVREEEAKIMKEITELENSFTKNGSGAHANKISLAQDKLERIRSPKIQGLITRSRVNWYDQGEKCTKYFLSLEKRNASKRAIVCLRNEDQIFTKKRDILREFTNYMTTRYKSNDESSDSNEYFLRNTVQKLTVDQKTVLEKPLDLVELTEALMSMKKGKSPGSNGFTAAFFKHFWNHMGVFVLKVFNHGMKRSSMIESFREGIITLIPKPGQNPESFKAWRPISLLNTDFKIISAAITARLKSVMSTLISPSQSAYIKGRYIGENSRLVYDAIDFIHENKRNGIILAADFEAAFETVSWPFMMQALKAYNFGNNFISVIKSVYMNNNNFARIMLDGFLGEKIHLNQGIRQGDPASGYLFNLVVEPLAIQLKASQKFTGLRINHNIEFRVSQYADDLIVFLEANESSLKGVVEEINHFSSFSGLRLNIAKTKCLPIGCISDSLVSNSLGIKFVDELKILGIVFNKTNTNISSRNIENKMLSIKSEIAQWNRRNLSLIGRVTVIKSLLMSKLVHILTALPNPSDKVIKEIESVFHSFLWKNRNDAVKRTKSVQQYCHDGINMIDILAFIKSMKISWMKRLHWSQSDWSLLTKSFVPSTEQILTFGTKKINKIANDTTNVFWKEVLQAWAQFIQIYQPLDEQILTDTIWFSNFTRFQTSIVNKWNDKGLRFIGDLINVHTSQLYTLCELRHKYNVSMTFMCYQALKHSLPTNIRNSSNLPHFRLPTIPYQITLMGTKINLSRLAYREFVVALRDKYQDAQQAWQNKWQSDGVTPYEGSIHSLRMATKNTYLQSFHYRIITRAIATNRFLYTIKRNDNPLCTFCSNSIESLVHLFWTCPLVQCFIQNLRRSLNDNFEITYQLEKSKWFFPSPEDCSKLEMLVITTAKSVIYKARVRRSRPTTDNFFNILRLEAEKERVSAMQKNKELLFREKWGNLIRVLNLSVA